MCRPCPVSRAADEGLQHRLERRHPRRDIAHRNADARHAVFVAGDGGEPALGLYQKIVGLEITQRALLRHSPRSSR